jgi:hypothetical protein
MHATKCLDGQSLILDFGPIRLQARNWPGGMGMDDHVDVVAETNISSQAELTGRNPTEVAQRENEEQPRLAPDNLARRRRAPCLFSHLVENAVWQGPCLIRAERAHPAHEETTDVPPEN